MLSFLVVAGVTGLYFSLSAHAIPGGDSEEIVLFAQSDYMYYFRSPLAVLLHQVAYKLLHPFGLEAESIIALASSLAGGLYVLALCFISLNPVFLIFNLTAPYIFIFISHVEHYAWVHMLLAWYIYFAYRFVKNKATIVPAVIFYIAACAFHNLALFYFPSLIFLCAGIKKEQGRLQITRHPALSERQVKVALILFVLYFLQMALLPLAFHSSLRGLDVGTERLCPLFSNPDPQHYAFTMFSTAHITLYFHFIMMSSPFAIPVILFLAPWFLKERFYWFLLVMTLCGLVWSFVWHPDMGRGDWDLFGSFAIPANVLAGLLLKDFIIRLSNTEKPRVRR